MTSFVLNCRKGQNYFSLPPREINFCFVLQVSDLYLPLKFVHPRADVIYIYANPTQLYCFLFVLFFTKSNLFPTLTLSFISRKEQYYTRHGFLALKYLPHECYTIGEKLSIRTSSFQNVLLLFTVVFNSSQERY